MRFPVYALALMFGSVAACSSDYKSPTESPPVKPLAVTHVDLTFTGSVPLFTSRANAINDAGVVVGSAAVNPSDPPRAVMWRPPGYAFEFLPGGSTTTASSANAIGRDGLIGGQIGCDDSWGTACSPVYWRDGVVHLLGGFGQVNGVCPCDSHTLVGQVFVNGESHGALWIDGVPIDVGTPAGFSDAQLVSVAHGFIVGNAFNGDPSIHVSLTAFRWCALERMDTTLTRRRQLRQRCERERERSRRRDRPGDLAQRLEHRDAHSGSSGGLGDQRFVRRRRRIPAGERSLFRCSNLDTGGRMDDDRQRGESDHYGH